MKVLKNTLILHGFDPHSPPYYLIHDFNMKVLSLVIVLTCVCVYSTTSLVRLVDRLLNWVKSILE